MKQKHNGPYWEPSFTDEVENKSIDDGVLFWFFGGATFGLRTSDCMIYLDPYFGGDPMEDPVITHRTATIALDPAQIRLCDAVLISHEHYDHCHENTLLAMAQGTKYKFYGPASVVEEMLAYVLPKERIQKVKPGDRIEIRDVVVHVCAGYDKDEPQAVTFLIEAGGIKIFFGGDSAYGPGFDKIGASGDLDIAMLAFGRRWYMNESEMLDAAVRLRPKLLLPYHWEMWRGYTGDVLKLGRLVERQNLSFEVRILLLGDCLYYRSGCQIT